MRGTVSHYEDPLGQSFSSQDSLAGWGNVTPKETYSSQDGNLGK